MLRYASAGVASGSAGCWAIWEFIRGSAAHAGRRFCIAAGATIAPSQANACPGPAARHAITNEPRSPDASSGCPRRLTYPEQTLMDRQRALDFGIGGIRSQRLP